MKHKRRNTKEETRKLGKRPQAEDLLVVFAIMKTKQRTEIITRQVKRKFVWRECHESNC